MISPYSYNPIETVYVLPEQFFSSATPRGEARLLFAVLEEALGCLSHRFVGGTSPAASIRIHQEAQDWIMSEENRFVFSFVNVCAALGLEPDYIRRGVLRPGFILPKHLRIVIAGKAPQQMTVETLQRIDLQAKRKAKSR